MLWASQHSKCGCCCAASEITELLHRSKFNVQKKKKKITKKIHNTYATHKKQQASYRATERERANNQNKERWSLEVVTTTTKTTEHWKWEKQDMLHGFFFVFCRCHCYCFCRIHCFVLCLCAFFRCSSFLSSFQFHLFTLYSVLSLHLSLSLYLATHTWFLRFVFSLKCFWTFYVSGCFVCARTMHIHIFHNAETNRRNILYEAEKRLNSCNTEQYMEYRDSPLKNNTT